jgi:hypothetical protein
MLVLYGVNSSYLEGRKCAPAGFDWISCLRAPTIQQLAVEGGPLQLSLFDDLLVSRTSPSSSLSFSQNADRWSKHGPPWECWRPSARW